MRLLLVTLIILLLTIPAIQGVDISFDKKTTDSKSKVLDEEDEEILKLAGKRINDEDIWFNQSKVMNIIKDVKSEVESEKISESEVVKEEKVTRDVNIGRYFKPSCTRSCGEYKSYWVEGFFACGFCGSTNLANNPKGVVEGEITCLSCDADYCGVCLGDKCSRPVYLYRC